MAPSSPTKASQARAMDKAGAGGSSRSTSSSTAASRLRAAKSQPRDKDLNNKISQVLDQDSSAATTDESYFSMSAAESAASSRAPSRTASAAAAAGNTSTSVRETRARTRAALQNSTNRPLSRNNTSSTASSATSISKKSSSSLSSTASSASVASSLPPSSTIALGLGRVKAQAKALESRPALLQQRSSQAILRAGEGLIPPPATIAATSSAVPFSGVATSKDGARTRGNAQEKEASDSAAAGKARMAAKKLPASKISCFETEDSEGIKAFLRIRPAPQEDKEYAEPYIQILNETQVLMKPPREGASNSIRARVHASTLPIKYTFTRVFAPTIPLSSPALSTPKPAPSAATNDQASFFQHTTLPLVRELLSGQSGLIFTYGVTNSGKSYTVLGGNRKNEAGILPRALDVIFNSIQGRHLDDPRVRPRGLVGVELLPPSAEVGGAGDTGGADASEEVSTASSSTPNTTVKSASGRPFVVPTPANRRGPNVARSASATTLGSTSNTITAPPMPVYDIEPVTVPIDKNYRYSVWVSYVEVYNEKLFDLLDAAVGEPGSFPGSGLIHQGRSSANGPGISSSPSKPSGGLAASFGISRSDPLRGSNWSIASGSGSGSAAGGSGERANMGGSSGDMMQTHHITLNRRPLVLKNDPDPNAGGKYVAGLSEHRVSSVQEAQALLQRGTENRIVFGTLANRMSSRSHGVFTIKVIREHAGTSALTSAAEREFYTSRLSIVDLAGSERASNTGLLSGERLKEAGNINKSLMCLGQCLETIRKNQARMASMIPAPVSVDVLAGGAPTATNSLNTGSVKRRLSVVPFRHSKLTELFQSFFPGPDVSLSGGGSGRAVMIVNANPFDTGYDENSHVMKFSAVARDVQVSLARGGGLPVAIYGSVTPSSSAPAFHSIGRSGVGVPPIRFGPSNPSARGMGGAATPSSERGGTASSSPVKKSGNASPTKASGTIGKNATGLSQADAIDLAASDGPEITIIEISDDEGDDDSDAFVDMLVEKHEELRQRLYECELNASLIEQRIRAEMADQMDKRMRDMERMYMDRLLNDAVDSETFMNRKLDLLAGELNRERTQTQLGPQHSSVMALQDPRTPTQSRLAAAAAKAGSSKMDDISTVDDSFGQSTMEVEDSLLDGDLSDEEDEDRDEDDDDDGDEDEDQEEGEDDHSLGVIESRVENCHDEEEGEEEDELTDEVEE
ncbi:hypothetical protein A4X13_0g3912 [Tilletia indica]|uniref:Uncharacterized protein n=1 Tax=Tilletia indica TaxID=43049 RepID=A0A177TR66_9BASI|nr:hypothetical protein A4X13_0g3912 [Tilletia indica]